MVSHYFIHTVNSVKWAGSTDKAGAMVCDITHDFHKLAKWKAAPRQDKQDANHQVTNFMQAAMDILRDIQKIAAFWEEKRRAYLSPSHFLPSKATVFTDLEREELEDSLLDSYKLCEQRLDELKNAVLSIPVTPQVAKVHSEIIHYLIDRIKRGISSTKDHQTKRMSRPFFLSKKLVPDGIEFNRSTIVLPKSKTAPVPLTTALPSSTPPSPARGQTCVDEPATTWPGISTTAPPFVELSSKNAQDDAMVFSEAETRQFHAENVQLHRHFHDEIDAARRVEKQVHDIRDMMHQFANEIGGQAEKMHVVAKEADLVAENVGHGNQSLKQAADYGHGLGFLIFCCYVGASTLLLFFHYY
ncbi:hypothetical protein, variant [Aphanomyces invadans]|uniref:t-SNARE coiled-coil homology domain-containing protein n=1 Tax=Aphanomyces invadans TaxID=157072 RepID=A0A024UMF2_9STRA|nr:hypothetical protein, variant [Aphanomyces invadans]ETW06798.1 hypothetical protein, variant [Aphanomyces invadans]|eukprot:XP_008864873.1 hypothetical protein, variant [Aphanomyces invadans]